MTELWKQLSKSFGSQWLLFSFMPAFTFWFLALLEWGLVHPKFLHLLENPPTHLITTFTLGVILTAWVLNLLTKPTLMFFEGYLLPREIKKCFLKRMIRKFNELHEELQAIKAQLKEHKGLSEVERLVLTERLYQIDSELGYEFPSRVEKLMPTKFGNILRSAEEYARKRYGLDPIVLWEHLFMKLPAETKNLLATNFSETMLMLRMCILNGLLALEWVILSLRKAAFFGSPNMLIFAILGLGVLSGISYLFYKISLVSLNNFAKTLRATFDLYRHDLLKSFGFEPPKDILKEREIWKTISRFVYRGVPFKISENNDES